MTEKQELRLEDKTSIAEVMANQLCEEFIDRIILLCIVAKDEISIQTVYKLMQGSPKFYDETEVTGTHIVRDQPIKTYPESHIFHQLYVPGGVMSAVASEFFLVTFRDMVERGIAEHPNTVANVEDFLYEKFIRVREEVRQLAEIRFSHFLHEFLMDDSNYPPSSDGQPLTMRAKLVVDVREKFLEKGLARERWVLPKEKPFSEESL